MKKHLFFSMMAAVAMFTSCSNEEVANVAGVPEGADGFVAFNIQMPTISGTRSNDQFDDGNPRPEEYQVHNAHLVLFTGATEADATFCGAYPLNIAAFNTVGTDTDQCTSEGIASSKITTPSIKTNLYAYVIINHNGVIANPAAGGVKVGETNVSAETTFATFSQIVLNELGNKDNGFLMTNCPLNSMQGGSVSPAEGEVYTLTTLDPTKIFPSAAEAEAQPAGEVFVERAAVKVTVGVDAAVEAKLTTAADVTYDKASIKWALCNENTKYYNTRQMKAAWLPLFADGSEGTLNTNGKYRFVSNAPIHAGQYRTYWGVDVNYNVAANEDFKANPTAAEIANAMGTSVYTYENTFDVDHQSSLNTTQVVFAVTFNGGNTFYTASTYGDNKILQVPTAEGENEKVQDYIMTYLCNNNGAFKTWYDNNEKNRITVTMAAPVNGEAAVDAVALAADAEALTGDLTLANLKTTINEAMKFKAYVNGLAYYNVRIKHFGAELDNNPETPWNAKNHTVNSIEGVYKTFNGAALTATQSDNNYLGRYGLLRNNWYQLQVTGIKQIGKPVPGDPKDPNDPWNPDTPDDEVENYISVKIHITPWALRKQGVVL